MIMWNPSAPKSRTTGYESKSLGDPGQIWAMNYAFTRYLIVSLVGPLRGGPVRVQGRFAILVVGASPKSVNVDIM